MQLRSVAGQLSGALERPLGLLAVALAECGQTETIVGLHQPRVDRESFLEQDPRAREVKRLDRRNPFLEDLGGRPPGSGGIGRRGAEGATREGEHQREGEHRKEGQTKAGTDRRKAPHQIFSRRA